MGRTGESLADALFLLIRRAVSLYNANRPYTFYNVGAEFPSGWLVTADGQDIITARNERIVITMYRDRIDSMWNADINVLGDSVSLEIVPAVRKIDVNVKGKLLSNLIEQMSIYDISRWDGCDSGLISIHRTALTLRGSNDLKDEVYYHAGYEVKKSAYKMSFELKLRSTISYRNIGSTSSSHPRDN